jgi:tRNA A37 N6-isopentenylltransferase MiaA
MNNMKQKIIAIVGPTGSGKTSLSIELAKKRPDLLCEERA